MTNLDRVLDEAMNLPLEQQEMLLQILQRRLMEQRRNEIAQDAKLSLAEFKAGKLKIQAATEAISELREFIQHE
jgi:transcriptional regulator with AAA-type ATPase domain